MLRYEVDVTDGSDLPLLVQLAQNFLCVRDNVSQASLAASECFMSSMAKTVLRKQTPVVHEKSSL